MSLHWKPLRAFLENPIFLSGISSWFLAQLAKAVIVLLRGRRRRDFLEAMLWKTGGMPSSHSALYSAMAASVAFSEGLGSNFFVIVFFIALTTMRDAMGVRRSAGLQARILNALGKDLSEISKREYHPVKEVHGHTPLEVLTGAILGIIIAAAVAFP